MTTRQRRRRKSLKTHELLSDTREYTLIRQELMQVIWPWFAQGLTAPQMQEKLADTQFSRYASAFKRQGLLWHLIRKAAEEKRLRLTPSTAHELSQWLETKYAWPPRRITTVVSPFVSDVATEAAYQVLDLIHEYKRHGADPVHIGFAGGRTLRRVAEVLARLLRAPSNAHPAKIVFHAMVAAFDEEHFDADPNNFITYFIRKPVVPQVAFNRLPAPGLVETNLRSRLQECKAIRDVHERARDINIIVTSGGSWADPHSPLPQYLGKLHPDDITALEARKTVGDVLWQPVTRQGPIDLNGLKYRPNTLVDLHELPERIRNGVRVLLVMGACSQCSTPHGEMLDVVLGNTMRFVSDVVTDSVTVHDLTKKTAGA